MTLTTYDEDLCKIVEPNVCSTKRRFEVLKICRDNGIPTVVWLDPILPFINDTRANIEGILGYCTEANVKGIICFSMGLTLREGNREYYYEKLDEHFPGLREKYQEKYGYAYEINSDNNKELMQLLSHTCKKHNIMSNPEEVFSYLHEFPENNNYDQMTLF
jgi:DNA repair photolyase